MKGRFWLIVIVAASVVPRLLCLDSVPPSLWSHELKASYVPYLYLQGVMDLPQREIFLYLLQGTFFSYTLGGASSFFTRLPAAIYGILLVIAVYKLGKAMFGEKVGLLAAGLMSVAPWAIILSRHQVPSMAIAVLATLLVLLGYEGIGCHRFNKKVLYYGLSAIILGLLVVCRSYNIPFLILLTIGLFAIFSSMKPRDKIVSSVLIVVVVAGVSLYLYRYSEFWPSFAREYSTLSHANGVQDLVRLVTERFCLHLSPHFLVLTGGAPYEHFSDIGWPTVTRLELCYSTGAVGMLNYWGVLIYPATFYLIYRIWKKRSRREENFILWWIMAYALASGAAYYGNPGAARNAFGLPALIITVSLFINDSYDYFRSRGNHTLKRAYLIGTLVLVLAPTGYFLTDYFFRYPARCAERFDYGLQETAQFLSQEHLSERRIYLFPGLSYIRYGLAFYSPEQPVDPENLDRYYPLGPSFDFRNLSFEKTHVSTVKPLQFEHGLIEFKVKLVKGYGGAASAHLNLVSDDNNMLYFALYADDSTYAPSTYLLGQRAGGENRWQFAGKPELRTLDRIEYGTWYDVRLDVTSDTVTFYFNGNLVTAWNRPDDATYSGLRLIGVSSSICFAELQVDGKQVDLGSGWEAVSGAWSSEQGVCCGDASIIMLLKGSDQLQELLESKVNHEVLHVTHNPDGSVAFVIVSMP